MQVKHRGVGIPLKATSGHASHYYAPYSRSRDLCGIITFDCELVAELRLDTSMNSDGESLN